MKRITIEVELDVPNHVDAHAFAGMFEEAIAPVFTGDEKPYEDGRKVNSVSITGVSDVVEQKYYKVDWVDTFDWEHYPSWETTDSLKKAKKEGSTNMQRVHSKKEITKEEYDKKPY